MLIERIKQVAKKRPRFGEDRVTVLLRKSSLGINHKSVERLWRQQGLQVPRKRRKKRRLGSVDHSVHRMQTQHKDHVWFYDFMIGQDGGRQAVKVADDRGRIHA